MVFDFMFYCVTVKTLFYMYSNLSDHAIVKIRTWKLCALSQNGQISSGIVRQELNRK